MILKLNLIFISINILASELDLSSRQWALKNTGQSYIRKISDMRFETINGSIGIDINQLENAKHSSIKKEVVVAIIDSGVDISHPEFKGRIWQYSKCIGKSKEDVKDLPCSGYNVLDGNTDLRDSSGHGTFVAGIIAANTDGIGVSGATGNNVKIMPIKSVAKFRGFTYKNKVVSSYLARAISFAVNNGADVINMSLGLPQVIQTKQIQGAIDYAISKNVIVVASAGNNSKKRNLFPCNYPGVTCVGAIDANGIRVGSSNYGHSVDVYAPGEKLVSTIPVAQESKVLRIGNYDIKTGTSFAVGYVSSLAAILKGINPSLNAFEFLSILNQSSTTLSDDVNLVNFSQAVAVEELMPIIISKAVDEVLFENGKGRVELSIYSHSDEVLSDELCFKANLEVPNCMSVELSKGENKVAFDLYTNEYSKLNEKVEATLTGAMTSKSIDINIVTNGTVFDSKVVSKIPAGAILRLARNLRSSELKKVIDYSATKKHQDYYLTQAKNKKLIYLLSEDDKEYAPKKITLSKSTNVLSIVKVDLNFDGVQDLLVYGTSLDKKSYLFHAYSQDAIALYDDKSTWSLRATEFGALDFNRGRAYFNFIKVATKDFGDINMPLVSKVFDLPSIDNNEDPIDFLNNIKKRRPYYLEPIVEENEVVLRIRTIESYDFDTKIRNALNLNFFDKIQFVSALEQSSKDRDLGINRLVFSVGEVTFNDYYILEFKGTKSFKEIDEGRSLQIQKSNITTIRDTQTGDFSKEFAITRQQSRNKLAIGFSGKRRKIRYTSDWNDPMVSILSIFDNGSNFEVYIESRYHIHLLVTDGVQIISSSKRPINRESSFPGTSFSQVFQISQLGPSKGAIYTDMQRLFGNSISVITSKDKRIDQSFKNSVVVPSNCAAIGHTQKELRMYIQLHCLNKDRKSSSIVSKLIE